MSRRYKTISIFNSAEHQIYPANEISTILNFFYTAELSMKFIMLMNIKLPIIVEHEKIHVLGDSCLIGLRRAYSVQIIYYVTKRFEL